MPIELWLGPVIIAAIVSGLVNVAGWFVTYRQSRRLEQMRRDEKVHDFQEALRAEIESDLLAMEVADNSALLETVRQGYARGNYRPLVPHLADNVIFEAIVDEIHLLPGEVIEPIIHYARLRQVLTRFVEDLRQAIASNSPTEDLLAMFEDYFDMLERLELRAGNAVAALDRSLSNMPALASVSGEQP